MRLLTRDERGELSPIERTGDNIPTYAILSHTWGEDGEVSYNELVAGTGKNKPGYKKIEFCVEQAARDGLQYSWVDTCCIDKSSSAELSEAINSMFKWYQNAAICYVYLCDLPRLKFEESRWFTRGWTLQELIAPQKLCFYDMNWNLVGTKDGLLNTIQDITAIETTALGGGDLRFFSIAKKMSWASNRRTTRQEDIAYCLLGIFDISMPLLYGEGTRAFIRLQEEIIKEHDDESLFAWTSNELGHVSGLLAPSPDAFYSSANIVPCHTRGVTPTVSAPITVTGRGIRLEVPVEEFDVPQSAYVIRLNCKPVFFERPGGVRVGVIITPVPHIEGYPSSAHRYCRIHPDKFHVYSPNCDLPLQPIFLLKENRLRNFDLATSNVFLVRTMPKWPQGSSYELVLQYPSEAWEEKNSTFRRQRLNNDNRPYILVFRRNFNDTYYDHFIIALGGEIKARHLKEEVIEGRVWCDVVFRRFPNIADLDLDRELLTLRRGMETVEVFGAGIIVKCNIRPETVSGQPISCVDIFVKGINRASTIM